MGVPGSRPRRLPPPAPSRVGHQRPLSHAHVPRESPGLAPGAPLTLGAAGYDYTGYGGHDDGGRKGVALGGSRDQGTSGGGAGICGSACGHPFPHSTSRGHGPRRSAGFSDVAPRDVGGLRRMDPCPGGTLHQRGAHRRPRASPGAGRCRSVGPGPIGDRTMGGHRGARHRDTRHGGPGSSTSAGADVRRDRPRRSRADRHSPHRTSL